MKPKIRYFPNLKELDPTGCEAVSILHAGEIHIDESLKDNPEELEKTIKHEEKHFQILEEYGHNRALFFLASYWLELTDSPAFRRFLLKLALLIVCLWFVFRLAMI